MSLISPDDYEPPLKLVRPRSWTLPEITRLAAEWISEQEGDTEMLRWTFSVFIEWLRKKEQS